MTDDPRLPFVEHYLTTTPIQTVCHLCGAEHHGDDLRITHRPWCRYAADMITAIRGGDGNVDTFIEDRRVASLPDEPDAALDHRLLLALAISPHLRDELDDDTIVAAAATIRARAHRLDFVVQDWQMERSFRYVMLDALGEIVVLLADIPERDRNVSTSDPWARWDRACHVARAAIASYDEFEGV